MLNAQCSMLHAKCQTSNALPFPLLQAATDVSAKCACVRGNQASRAPWASSRHLGGPGDLRRSCAGLALAGTGTYAWRPWRTPPSTTTPARASVVAAAPFLIESGVVRLGDCRCVVACPPIDTRCAAARHPRSILLSILSRFPRAQCVGRIPLQSAREGVRRYSTVARGGEISDARILHTECGRPRFIVWSSASCCSPPRSPRPRFHVKHPSGRLAMGSPKPPDPTTKINDLGP